LELADLSLWKRKRGANSRSEENKQEEKKKERAIMGNQVGCFICINTSEVGMITRFGEFSRQADEGFNIICCPCEQLQDTVSLRVQQLEVRCDTKTSDNVMITVMCAVQYQVLPDKVHDAFYRLTNPKSQITSYIEDVVRSTIPKMTLDQAYESKAQVASTVREALQVKMESYGYAIHQALVTDLTPDERVRRAMNEINANRRLREAATAKAEADKIMLVKAAEADAESKYLSGVGIARQRKAIVDGLRDSVLEFSGNVPGTGPSDVINLLMITQYFDMLKEVGNNPSSTTIYVPDHGGPKSVADEVRSGLMEGNTAIANMMR